jgi:hypothetical protein
MAHSREVDRVDLRGEHGQRALGQRVRQAGADAPDGAGNRGGVGQQAFRVCFGLGVDGGFDTFAGKRPRAHPTAHVAVDAPFVHEQVAGRVLGARALVRGGRHRDLGALAAGWQRLRHDGPRSPVDRTQQENEATAHSEAVGNDGDDESRSAEEF